MSDDLNTVSGRINECERQARSAMNSLHCGSENWEYRQANKTADFFSALAADLGELEALRVERDRLREALSMLEGKASAVASAISRGSPYKFYVNDMGASIIAARSALKQPKSASAE